MQPWLLILLHLTSSVGSLLKPGGAKALVAENFLLRHQLLILRRARQRAPNLRFSDRLLRRSTSATTLGRPTAMAYLSCPRLLDYDLATDTGEIVSRSEDRIRIGQNDPEISQHSPFILITKPRQSIISRLDGVFATHRRSNA